VADAGGSETVVAAPHGAGALLGAFGPTTFRLGCGGLIGGDAKIELAADFFVGFTIAADFSGAFETFRVLPCFDDFCLRAMARRRVKVVPRAGEIENRGRGVENRDMQNPQPRRGSILARGSVVRVAVFLSILLVMGMTASLWERWTKVKEPTTAIAVYGDESLDGARIVVEGSDEETQRQPPVEVTLSAEQKFQQAIYRYPGRYHVTVSVPWPSRKDPIANADMTIDRFHGAVVDLPTTLTIDGSPGDRVTISNEFGSQTVEPNSENHYHVVVLLGPGKYRMTRTHGGAMIMEDEVVIEPHKPRKIALPAVP
jgi:hypothetical protein